MVAARLLLATGLTMSAMGAGAALAQVPLPPEIPELLDPAPSAQQEGDVNVADNAYEPETFTTEAGATVVWRQTGGNPHSVTADDGAFDSHPDCALDATSECMGEGDTFEHTFTESGTFAYHCRIHENIGMTGVVEVSASGEVTTTTDAAPTTTSASDETEVAGASALPATGAPLALGTLGAALIAAAGVLRRQLLRR